MAKASEQIRSEVGADMNAFERGVTGVRILTYPELKTLKGISFSRQYLAVLEATGKFPQRVPLGIGNGRIGWIEAEIDEWLKGRAAARDSKKPPSA